MTSFTGSDDLRAATFTDVDLQGARFVRANLGRVVMRGVDLDGADLDAPWLLDGTTSLVVNGVDVAPLVEVELNRQFPGRAGRRANDPDGLRTNWAALEGAWSAAMDRVGLLPPEAVDVSVDGEWSFSQTLRHLIMATDVWFRGAILGLGQPFHPLGQPNAEYETDGNDLTVFTPGIPQYAEVLAARADHVTLVHDFLATVTEDVLGAAHPNPWAPDYPETTLSCLQTILEEEWEHLRYALRDLDVVEARGSHSASDPLHNM